MAKIVFGPLVGDARRKIGGIVFTKGRSGAVVRRKVSPVQPRSSAQRNVRADFTALSKTWSGSTMDDTKRAGWNALASNYPQKDKFGASHTLTGLQMFQKLNRALTTIGQDQITSPPATLTCGFPGALTVTASAPATLSVAYANPTVLNEMYAAFAAAQVSPGRLSIGNKYRYLGVHGYGAGPADLGAAYVAKFGNLIAGKKVPILLKFIDGITGAAGIPSSALQVVS